MENTQKMNAQNVLNTVNQMLESAEAYKAHFGWAKRWQIGHVCNDLSIFDWWNDWLSVSQLKQMKKFLETAIQMGYVGYVCFKVGAAGCSHGMWAHKEESTTGYSPDGECLFHSFRSGDNYWDVKLPSGEWLGIREDRYEFTLKEIKAVLAA